MSDYVDFIEYYAKTHCPKCKHTNFIYAFRHPYDETGIDADAVRCCYCKHVYALMSEADFKESHCIWDDDEDDENKGKTFPELIEEYGHISDGFKFDRND